MIARNSSFRSVRPSPSLQQRNTAKLSFTSNLVSKPKFNFESSSMIIRQKHSVANRPIPRSEEVADIRNMFKDFNVEEVKDPMSLIPKNKEYQSQLLKQLYKYSKTASKSGLRDDIEAALDAYQGLTIKFDIRVFGAILKMCGKLGMVGEAVEIYHDIRYRGMKPNYAIYEHLFEACLNGESIERGMYFFKEMENNIPCFGVSEKSKTRAMKTLLPLLRLCYRSDRPDRAAVVVAEIWRHKLFRGSTLPEHRPRYVWLSLISKVTPNRFEAERFKTAVDCYMNGGTADEM